MIELALAATVISALYMFLLRFVLDAGSREREQVNAAWSDAIAKIESRHQKERHDWILERASLLERIQRPDFRPPDPIERPPIPDTSIQDELHLVGQVIEQSDQPA